MYLSRWSLRLPRQAARCYAITPKPSDRRDTVDRSRWSKSSISKHPRRLPQRPENSPAQSQNESSSTDKVANALRQRAENSQNNLIAPVHIPEDPHGIIKERHPAAFLLANPSIVVQRQLEMMNVLMGFEQANRYVIMDATGNHIGYLAEQEHGVGSALYRQMARTHRSFTTHLFDREEKEVLRFYRPFSWISSRIRVYDAIGEADPAYSSSTALQNTSTGSVVDQTSAQISQSPLKDMRLIGEAQQQWAPLRRKYNLFLHRDAAAMDAKQDTSQSTAGSIPLSDSKSLQPSSPETPDQVKAFFQFAYVNEPFLSWDFSLISASDQLLGSVNRNFAGFAREIFTDTGVYALRMDAAGLAQEPRHLVSRTATTALARDETQKMGMTLDQRAVMLATAVSIDFDYFSRHSGAAAGGGFFPIWFPMGGGEAAGGAAGDAAAGEAGAAGVTGAGEAAAGMAGRAGGAEGAAGAISGAGTMAGYEAMQRGREGATKGEVENVSGTNNVGGPPHETGRPGSQEPPQEEVWGEDLWEDDGGDDGADVDDWF